MKGDRIYVWQVLQDGEWGAIAAVVIPGMGATVLTGRTWAIAEQLGVFAHAHHDATGLPVRCARFDHPTVVAEIPQP